MSAYLTAALVITDRTSPPSVHSQPGRHGPPIASVRLDDGGLTIQSSDPARLLAVASAFTEAAMRLAAGLAVAAAFEDAAMRLAAEPDRDAARAMTDEATA